MKAEGTDYDFFTEMAYVWAKHVQTKGATFFWGEYAGLYCGN